MPNKKTDATKPVMQSESEVCPVEALMREHAAMYRAKVLAESIADEDEDENNEIISNWSTGFLWSVMIQRINGIEALVNLEQPTSEVGVLYKLMLARSMGPVSELLLNSRNDKSEIHGRHDALQSEYLVQSHIDSAIYFLLQHINDPDIDLLLPFMGPPEPMNATTAVQNLLDQVRNKKAKLKVAA